LRRPGHTRPLGSVTAPQRFEWGGQEPPELGDIACEITYPDGDPDELERAFLVVGIAETSSRRFPYRLTFERVAYGTPPAQGRRTWTWYRIPRDAR
jgi:hypothetical protein